MEYVDICFIADSGYIVPTITAITSIITNKDTNSNYRIYIVTNDFNPKQTKLFEKMASQNVSVKVILVDVEEDYKYIKSNNIHVTSTALYKFSLAHIFCSLDKILYLDGDVIVKKDLYNFFNIDLDGNYAAVVKDYRAVVSKPNPLQYLQLPSAAYFNSGVMLLNLKKLREDNVKSKLMDYRINGYNHFMDQDTLNVVFGNRVIYLPIHYNAMYSTLSHFSDKDICNYYSLVDFETRDQIYANSVVVHLCSPTKPWECFDSWHADEWYSYYKRSPMGNRVLNRTYRNPPKTKTEKIKRLFVRGYCILASQGLLALIKKGYEHICNSKKK